MRKWKDKMTSKERMDNYFEGKEIDRLPFSVSLGDAAAKFIDINTYDYAKDLNAMVDVETFCYNRFGTDGVSIKTGLHGIAEAMGSKLNFPKNGLISVTEHLLSLEKNHNSLEPANPKKDGRLPVFLQALEKLQEQSKDLVDVNAMLAGPFTTLSSLRGSENLMKDLYYRPETVLSWLEIINESIYSYIDEVSKLNVGFSLAEPVASGSLISPKMFRTFVKPYLTKCSDRIFKKTQKRPSLHICGQTSKILHDMVDVGISTLSLDNVVDMEFAKEEVGNKVCLAGNVKPVETILNGSKEDIFREVKGLVKLLHDSPKKYILMPGCQLPMNVTIEKVDMYVEAAHRFGTYPINL